MQQKETMNKLKASKRSSQAQEKGSVYDVPRRTERMKTVAKTEEEIEERW